MYYGDFFCAEKTHVFALPFVTYTGCPGKFGIAKTAGVAEMLGSAINMGTQGGYTMVPQTPNVPSHKKFLF